MQRRHPRPAAHRMPAAEYSSVLAEVLSVRFSRLCRMLLAVSLGVGVLCGRGCTWVLRTPPIFAALFAVLVYRKSFIRVSQDTRPTLFSQMCHSVASKQFLWALCSLVFSSAVFYCSIPTGLAFTVAGEQCVYFFCFVFYVPLVFSLLHVFLDFNTLPFALTPATSPKFLLQSNIFHVSKRALAVSLFINLTFPILYLVNRKSIRSKSLCILRLFFKLPNSNYLSSSPIQFNTFIFQLSSSILLIWLWEFTNLSFTAYISMGCLHHGKLLTSKSNDPNGTLITGLKNYKNPFTRLMAFQELYYISINDKKRRITIFKDIERPITIWKSILKECIDVIDGSKNEIEKSIKSNKINNNKSIKNLQNINNKQNTELNNPIKKNIFLPEKSETTHKILIQFQDPKAIKSKFVLNYLINSFQIFKKYINNYYLNSNLINNFLKSSIGILFRKTIQRNIKKKINNTNKKRNFKILNLAILSLSFLTIRSYDEDKFGILQNDISFILKNFKNFIIILKKFKSSSYFINEIHWSDIKSKELLIKNEKNKINLKIIDLILNCLEFGFHDIIFQFVDYLDVMDLEDEVKHMALKLINSIDEVEEDD